jgi:beta-mannosidase
VQRQSPRCGRPRSPTTSRVWASSSRSRRKAGYYCAKRAFAPVLASFQPVHDQGVELWIANSTADIIGTEAAVQLAAFDGTVHNETTVQVEIAPASAVPVWRGTADEVGPDWFAWVSSLDGTFPANRAFFDHRRICRGQRRNSM